MERTIHDVTVPMDDLWRYEDDARHALDEWHESPVDDEPDWDEPEDAGVTDCDAWNLNG